MVVEVGILVAGWLAAFGLPQLARGWRGLGVICAGLALAIAAATWGLVRGGVNEFTLLFLVVLVMPWTVALIASGVARAVALARGRRSRAGVLVAAGVALLPFLLIGV